MSDRNDLRPDRFARTIATARRNARLTLDQVARAMTEAEAKDGLDLPVRHRSVICHWERGDHRPHPSTWPYLAAALRIPVALLDMIDAETEQAA